MSQPPIVPGPSEPYTLGNLMPPAVPTPKRQRRWLVPTLAAVAVLAVGAAAFLYLGGLDRLRAGAADAGLTDSVLKQAWLNCGQAGQLADSDTTLVLDLSGRAANSGPVGQASFECYLRELKTPTYVIEQIGNTRAMDGQMKATWAGLEASWTYHPDQGLNLVIHQT